MMDPLRSDMILSALLFVSSIIYGISTFPFSVREIESASEAEFACVAFFLPIVSTEKISDFLNVPFCAPFTSRPVTLK